MMNRRGYVYFVIMNQKKVRTIIVIVLILFLLLFGDKNEDWIEIIYSLLSFL